MVDMFTDKGDLERSQEVGPKTNWAKALHNMRGCDHETDLFRGWIRTRTGLLLWAVLIAFGGASWDSTSIIISNDRRVGSPEYLRQSVYIR